MSVQAHGDGRPELAELAAIARHRDQLADPQHAAGLITKEIPVLNEQWRKSTRSNNNGACVEVRQVGDVIEVRNSKRPDAGLVQFTKAEWHAFVGGVEDGEFTAA